MLLAASHRAGRSMLLVSLLAMCKTAGAIECGSQTLGPAKIASVQTCTIINGDLLIESGGAVQLPNLRLVIGDVRIYDNRALTSLSVPVLASVGGYFGIYDNGALTSLSLPVLASIGRYFSISGNDALTSLGLPVLASVGEYFQIYDNGALTSLSIPALASVLGTYTSTSVLTLSTGESLPPGWSFLVDLNTDLEYFNAESLDPANPPPGDVFLQRTICASSSCTDVNCFARIASCVPLPPPPSRTAGETKSQMRTPLFLFTSPPPSPPSPPPPVMCECETITVAGAENYQWNKMGTFTRLSIATSDGRWVYQNPDSQYLFYAYSDWQIGPDYTTFLAGVRSTSGLSATCPTGASDWEAWDGSAWILPSGGITVSCPPPPPPTPPPSNGSIVMLVAVGGAGGTVVLVALVLLFCYFCCRNRKKPTPSPPPEVAPAPQSTAKIAPAPPSASSPRSGGGAAAAAAENKYEAQTLFMGQGTVAAHGLDNALGISSEELPHLLMRGAQAIVDEFEEYGSADDKANIKYILHGTACQEPLPEHIRTQITTGKYHGGSLGPGDFDKGHAGWTFNDFVKHPHCIKAKLEPPHVLALRAYTSSSYPCFNDPLRMGKQPHPFKMTVYYLDAAIRRLRAVPAQDDPDFKKEVSLWRGMRDMTIMKGFLNGGGTEMAPMSTSRDKRVALKYAASVTPLVFHFKAKAMAKGVSIDFLSLYPMEKEYLYPPLTYLNPRQHKKKDGYHIVVVDPQF